MTSKSWTQLDVNGFTLSKLGDGPLPMITLHGGPGMSDYMDEVADEFNLIIAANPAISVYTYQQRGLSPSPLSGPHTIEQHMDDLMGIMDGIGVASAVIFGHSWGGHLAMHVAAHHPERVLALISVDALGAISDGGEAAMGVHFDSLLTPEEREFLAQFDDIPEAEQTEEVVLQTMDVLWKYYFADPSSAPPMPPMRATVEGYVGSSASVKSHFEAETLVQKLPGFANPALFIAVSRGPIPAAANIDSAALVPQAEVVLLETGHFPWFEEPGRLGTVVGEFLRQRLHL